MLYNLIFFELKYWPQHVNLGQVSDREAADMTQRNLEIPHLVQISALPNHCWVLVDLFSCIYL